MSRPLFTSLKSIAAAASGLALAMASSAAFAAPVISPISTNAGITTILINSLLAPSSGISVVGGSATYQGTNTTTFQQSATYTGFNLAPSSGSTPTLALANGMLLTSGNANVPLNNTGNEFTGNSSSGSNAQLSALSASAGNSNATNDANVLSFNFNVGAGITSVSAQFVFATDEFPTQLVTDIFGFFVDGVNYAKFSSCELIANTPGNPTNFILNPVGGGLYDIEYNGLTQVFTVTGLFGAGNPDGSHTISIGVADTNDSRFDSAVFIGNLNAGTSTGGGITKNVPEPASLALVGAGLAAVFANRRRNKQA